MLPQEMFAIFRPFELNSDGFFTKVLYPKSSRTHRSRHVHISRAYG